MNKGREKRIAALNEAQEQRRLDCLDKTEKAIVKLSQTNQKLSFANIAREAKVSISYLYKYSEIKQRIQYLRKQQEENAKLVKPQLRTEKSSQTIIHQLKNRIKTLDAEKKELTKQNEALTGRLYALGNSQDMIARLQTENSQLKNKVQQLKAELEVIKSELNEDNKQQSKTKVIPINQGHKLEKNEEIKFKLNLNKTNRSEISEVIKLELNALEIKLNSTLKKLIKASSEQIVLNAIEALKEANSTGEVLKPGAWLVSAIENGWTKNENEVKQQQEKTVDYFTKPVEEQDELISLEELKQLGFMLGESTN